VIAAASTMVWGSSVAPVRINWTGSAPVGLYAISVKTPVSRADLVVVCLQGALATRGRARGYLAAGSCPRGISPILKQVAATASDEVELRSDGLAVNGQIIDRSQRLVEDSLGRPLEALPLGRSVVREGEIWVLGVHPVRSWDSRYFGSIPVSSVVGVARPILTLNLDKAQ
jgi:conjugative transfer signal peptidase TraF